MIRAKTAALVLAAGLSSRMGRLKPLLRLDDGTVIQRVISLFTDQGVDVIVVTGCGREKVEAAVAPLRATTVFNADFEQGMFTSIQAGIKALRPEHASFFVMPVDIPLVRPATIARLLSVASDNPRRVLVPTIGDRHGHPPLLPVSLVPAVLDWKGEGGLKAVLAQHPELTLDVPVADSNVLLDVDSPEDYTALLRRWEKYDLPDSLETEALLAMAGTPENIRRHCGKVAEIALVMAQALVAAGHTVDTGLIRTAALLHDVLKVQPEHDAAGASLLSFWGFRRAARVVALHTYLPDDCEASIEAKIVYLADKFAQDDRAVPLEERYRTASKKHASMPDAAARIERGQRQAFLVLEELERLAGKPLGNLIL